MMKSYLSPKTIPGHSGVYLIYPDGRVFNTRKGTDVIPVIGSNGYMHVTLCYGERKTYSVHRLVADAFLENPNNYPVVNHKDEDKTNNDVENLEWCSVEYNTNYGDVSYKMSPVRQLDMEGNYIRTWSSMKDVADLYGFKYQSISRVCRGIRKSAYGFKWEYAT